MDKENGRKKCLYDGIKISKGGLDAIVFTLSLLVLTLILYAIVISA